MSMSALPVVEDLDVIEHVTACFLTPSVDAARTRSFFRLLKNDSAHRVVPAVAASTHADLQAVFAAEATPVVATVLHALVGESPPRSRAMHRDCAMTHRVARHLRDGVATLADLLHRFSLELVGETFACHRSSDPQ